MSSPEIVPPAERPPLPPSPAAATLVTPAPAKVKEPWVALLLSLLMPGLGQVYNGQIAKGLTFFAAFTGSIYLIADGHPLPFAFVLPFVLFWNMLDAFRTATLISARGLPASRELEDEQESPGWGVALAVIGLLLLLNNMGWLRLADLARFWPILLIAAGLVLLRRSVQRKNGHGPSV
jgi:TM2 domain-containing membrane protein YozV